ncbi:MAG: 3-deoxy-7-phosphoheptulonate synthase [Armatimonadetes bacterium]|nr:MAG: 3-deoxy-7-phosphoheptulonate synthase [Armatimonadota bacterium]
MSEQQPDSKSQLKSQRKPDVATAIVPVADTRFGDGSFPVLAGPGAVESESQIMATAAAVSEAGGLILRSATFLPAELAGDFNPLGTEGLWLLEHASRTTGLATSTFVFEPDQASIVANHVDLIEVGPSRMTRSDVLTAVGETGLPVVVHRGEDATVDGWLAAARAVAGAGSDVILCERGSQGHDPRTAGTLDISAVAVVQQLSDFPVVVNPAPLVGSLDLIAPLALAARIAGADGLMVAVHPNPSAAQFRAGGHLDLDAFELLMDRLGIPSLRDDIDRIDRELLKLIARRLTNSVNIGLIKASKGLPMESSDREAELIAEARSDALAIGLDPDYIEDVMRVVLAHSKAAQEAAARDA